MRLAVAEEAQQGQTGRGMGEFVPGKLVVVLAVALMLSLLGNAILMALRS